LENDIHMHKMMQIIYNGDKIMMIHVHLKKPFQRDGELKENVHGAEMQVAAAVSTAVAGATSTTVHWPRRT